MPRTARYVTIATTDATAAAVTLGAERGLPRSSDADFARRVDVVVGAVARLGRPVHVLVDDGSFSTWKPRSRV